MAAESGLTETPVAPPAQKTGVEKKEEEVFLDYTLTTLENVGNALLIYFKMLAKQLSQASFFVTVGIFARANIESSK